MSNMPLLLLGGAALLLMSKKGKKGNGEAPAEEEKGFELEVPPEPPGPGPVEIEPKTSVEPEPEPEPEAGEVFVQKSTEDIVTKCNRFIEEIWVEVDDEDELPILSIAVEESILPALHDYISAVADEKGSRLKDQDVMPEAALAGLEAVAPGCGWEVIDLAWRFAGGLPIVGKVRDVVVSVMELVPKVMNDVNREKGYTSVFTAKKIDDGGGGGGGGISGG